MHKQMLAFELCVLRTEVNTFNVIYIAKEKQEKVDNFETALNFTNPFIS
jgi:hypothetical protein